MITDKMVEAACAAYYPGSPFKHSHVEIRLMRAALEAADAVREACNVAMSKTSIGMTEILEKQRQVSVIRSASPPKGTSHDT